MGTSTTVNEATFAPTTAPPAAADFLKNLFDKTTTISPAPEDPLIAIWNALTGVQDRGDPITAVVGELTLSGDRHNCFGLFDGIVGPLLGLGESTEREIVQFIKHGVRQAEGMGLFEAVSQIMAVTGVPFPDSCKCDCGCRASPTLAA